MRACVCVCGNFIIEGIFIQFTELQRVDRLCCDRVLFIVHLWEKNSITNGMVKRRPKGRRSKSAQISEQRELEELSPFGSLPSRIHAQKTRHWLSNSGDFKYLDWLHVADDI